MTDWTSGLLPQNVAADVLSAAAEESAVRAHATTRPMLGAKPTAAVPEGGPSPESRSEFSGRRRVAEKVTVCAW